MNKIQDFRGMAPWYARVAGRKGATMEKRSIGAALTAAGETAAQGGGNRGDGGAHTIQGAPHEEGGDRLWR